MNTIEEAIEDIKQGRIVIVVDDEDRENEGDFVTAARNANPELINFMATHGRGLICTPLIEERCDKLGLEMMVDSNNSHFDTPFTVSIDLIGDGCSTGISTADRAKTVQALIDPNTKPKDLGKPGHIFPLRAKAGGVLRRAGHTEAAVDLSRLAGFEPAGLIVEIMNEDGTMARLPELKEIAKRFNLKIVTIESLIAYRMQHETLIEEVVEVDLPTKYGDFKLKAFKQTTTSEEHLALVKGKWDKNESVLVRVHSSCFTGDILGSLRCDCGDQLNSAMKMIDKAGKGVVLYVNQEGRGIGLINKLKAYKLQEDGFDTLDANLKLGFKGDARDYGVGAQILRAVGVQKMKLLTNNPKKRTGLTGYGLKITETVNIEIECNVHNEKYLETKKEKMGHDLKIKKPI
tara:strand:- start:403 stop:1611 length:1209 start_codon:yes stop_codon:yes gene_type:complete